jgi:hypothetical protein
MDRKDGAMRVQRGMKTLLGIRLEAIHVPLWQRPLSTFYLCPETLWEAELKGDD